MDTEPKSIESGHPLVLQLGGERTQAPGIFDIRRKILELMEEGNLQFVLNLDAVRDLNNSAVRELVAVHSAATSLGGTIKLVSSRRRQHDIRGVAKLLAVFDAYEDEASAIRSFVFSQDHGQRRSSAAAVC